MDIPVSDHLFSDDELVDVKVGLERQVAERLARAAQERNVSTDQMLRYVVNVGWSVVERRREDDEDREAATDRTAPSRRRTVMDEIRSAVDRLHALQDRQREIEAKNEKAADGDDSDRLSTSSSSNDPNDTETGEQQGIPDDVMHVLRRVNEDDLGEGSHLGEGDHGDPRDSIGDDATSMFDLADDK